jgi:transaldolase
MKFFVDTADTADIRDLAETGLLDGVTTNPSLVHKSGRDFLEVVTRDLPDRDGPGLGRGGRARPCGMMREAEVLRKIADNIAVKVPLTSTGSRPARS